MANGGLAGVDRPAPISKLPLGLLGFLGIKSFGQYPNSLGSQISPGLDLLGLFSGAHAEHANGGAVNAAAGYNTVALTVPQNEIWYVTMAHAVATLGAGTAITMQLAVQPSVGADIVLTELLTGGASAGSIMSPLLREVWLGPGDDLGIRVGAFTGVVPINARCRRIVFTI